MIEIYHNPRCAKSRAGLAFLEAKQVPYKVIPYLKEGITAETIQDLCTKTGLSAFDLVRTQEADYKENYKHKSMSESQWIDAIAAKPKLLQRPIVVHGEKAVLALPAEKIEEII